MTEHTIESSDAVVALASQDDHHAEVIVMEIGTDVASFEPGQRADLCGEPCIDPQWDTWRQGEMRLIRVPLAEYNVFPHTA